MTPKEIKKRLLDLNLTVAELARRLSTPEEPVTKQAVSQVIHGDRQTPWIRRGVAEELGMTYRGLWGEDDPGTPRGTREKGRARRMGSLHSSSVAPIAPEIDGLTMEDDSDE